MPEEISSITAEDVRRFATSLRNKGRLTSLITGNCTEEAALAIARTAIDRIGCGPWDVAPIESVLDMKPEQPILRLETVVNTLEGNSCIEYYLQIGPAADARRRALLDLVDQVLYEPCYNTLRTKQQLGYIVSSGTRLTQGILGLCIIIQSKTHSATAMEARIDEFLTDYLHVLEEMSEEDFHKNANALIEHKRTKPMTISNQAERFWDSLVHRAGEFDHREADVLAIQSTSKTDVLDFYRREVAPGGKLVRKLVVLVEKNGDDSTTDDPRLVKRDQLDGLHHQHAAFRDESILQF